MIFLLFLILTVQILGAFSAFTKINVLLVSVVSLIFLILKNRRFLLKNLRSIFKNPYSLIEKFRLIIHEHWSSLLVIFVITFLSAITPIYETDSIAYHLPIVEQLIKTSSVWQIFHSGFVGPNTFFSANHEAIQAFFQILTGSAFFRFIPNLIGIFIFHSSLKEFSKTFYPKSNLSNFSFFVIIFAIISIPFLFEQIVNPQVDLFILTLFGAATCQILITIKEKSLKNFAKFFLASGILVGTKYNAIPELILLIPLIIIAFYHFRKKLKFALPLSLLTILAGSGWYIRNAILTGNPLFPFSLNLGPVSLEGYAPFNAELANTSLLFNLDKGPLTLINYILTHHGFGYNIGYFALLIFPLAIAALIFIYQKNKKTAQKNFLFYSLIYLFLAETFYYISSPYTYTLWNQTIRYSAPVFALFPILFVVFAATANKIRKSLIASLLIFIFVNILGNSFISTHAFAEMFISKTKNLINPAIPSQQIDDHFLAAKSEHYNSYLPILKLLRTENTNSIPSEKISIALVGILDYWIFQKENLNPIYVNIDGCLECEYYDYKGTNNSIRKNPDKGKWEKALGKAEISHLLINKNYNQNHEPFIESIWANNDKKTFEKLFENENYEFYKINN